MRKGQGDGQGDGDREGHRGCRWPKGSGRCNLHELNSPLQYDGEEFLSSH